MGSTGNMKTRLTLKAGKPGTDKMVARYGDRLYCVRYRYDAQKKKRLKTVELIIEETDWEPRKKSPKAGNSEGTVPDNQAMSSETDRMVGIRITIDETDLQAMVRGAGGIWNRSMKLWIMQEARAKELGLENRIVQIGS